LHANSNELYNIRHLDAFTDGSVHLKKPSGGPKGLIGPPLSMPWGPWPPEAFFEKSLKKGMKKNIMEQ
jgi:hypothetical protein